MSRNPIEEMEKRLLALCITKCDRLGFPINDGRSVADACFGSRVGDLLRHHEKQNLVKGEVFNTSAIGYCESSGFLIPNADRHHRSIRHPELWSPFNVAAPFFWIFEEVERKRLTQTLKPKQIERHYVPSPRPKLLPSMLIEHQ